MRADRELCGLAGAQHSEGGGDHQTSQAALKEQRAMESIKLRRQQELEQMVAYELKLTETAAEQQRNQACTLKTDSSLNTDPEP